MGSNRLFLAFGEVLAVLEDEKLHGIDVEEYEAPA